MKIKLGEKYRDKVTGFIGIATAKHTWLTGCDTVTLTPRVDYEGKLRGTEGFDVSQLEEIGKDKPPEIKSDRSRGGPHDHPAEQHR